MLKVFLRLLFLLPALLGSWSLPPLRAVLDVQVTGGTFTPLPIAFAFEGQGVNADLVESLLEVIKEDLSGAGVCRVVTPSPLPQSAGEALHSPHYVVWQATGAQLLLVGQMTQADSKLRVSCRLINVLNGAELLGFSLSGERGQKRRLAHKVADEVYKQLTGMSGYFDTRLAYVGSIGAGKKSIFQIALMDCDGANHQVLKTSRKLLKMPSFSPQGDRLAFIWNENGFSPKAYVFDQGFRHEKVIPTQKGLVFAVRFMPDGQRLMFSFYNSKRQMSVALGDLKGGAVSDILSPKFGVTTSPSVDPSGNFLVFNSDRRGNYKLHTMPIAGGEILPVSWGSGKYTCPSWSPQGDKIAFLKQEGGFSIGVMNTDGADERLLCSFYHADTPAWVPSGAALVFSAKETARSKDQIYILDLASLKTRRILTPDRACEPACCLLR